MTVLPYAMAGLNFHNGNNVPVISISLPILSLPPPLPFPLFLFILFYLFFLPSVWYWSAGSSQYFASNATGVVAFKTTILSKTCKFAVNESDRDDVDDEVCDDVDDEDDMEDMRDGEVEEERREERDEALPSCCTPFLPT